MFSEEQLLATAKASPAAVARHDKAAWLDLFSADAEVHDPVGSRPHAGRAALERFYETFIAPNDIRFEVEHDIICGQTVVRDLVIRTRMGGTALTVGVPLFIRYEIVEQGGEPRVRRLYAHWELLSMMGGQVFSSGIATGLLALIRLSGNMLRQQGLRGALGFSRAFGGVGRAARACAGETLDALAAGDDLRASACLSPDCTIVNGLEPVALAALAQELKGLRWSKLLLGGHQACARLDCNGRTAVALLDFADDSRHVKRLRIYRDAPAPSAGRMPSSG